MFKNISATCRNSVLWRKSPDEYWAHSRRSHRSYIWGTPEANGCLAESQWRSHLWNKAVESTERHGHTRRVVRPLNQYTGCVQRCVWKLLNSSWCDTTESTSLLCVLWRNEPFCLFKKLRGSVYKNVGGQWVSENVLLGWCQGWRDGCKSFLNDLVLISGAGSRNNKK